RRPAGPPRRLCPAAQRPSAGHPAPRAWLPPRPRVSILTGRVSRLSVTTARLGPPRDGSIAAISVTIHACLLRYGSPRPAAYGPQDMTLGHSLAALPYATLVGEAALVLRLGKVVSDSSPPERRRRTLTRRHVDRTCGHQRWSAHVGRGGPRRRIR